MRVHIINKRCIAFSTNTFIHDNGGLVI